jgi:hypothetical protein
MSTETQSQVIELSFHVKDIAKGLMECPGCPKVICAIYRSGRALRTVHQYQSLGIAEKYAQDVAENIADECETQAILKAAGITDGESAISYMEKVRPVLYALNSQVSEIKERCNVEIGNLLSGITEEFWRSL